MCLERSSQLSVIMPVKNPSMELITTVNSILNSDCIPFELLIINDYSDSGFEFFSKVRINDVVTVVDNQYAPGISNALNVGIKKSTGKYIARIDCGDTVYKDRFSKQIKILETNKECNLVVSSASVIGAQKSSDVIHAKLRSIGMSVSPFSKLPHPSWMFRKNSISSMYDPRFIRCEDYGFLVENFLTNQIIIINEPLIYYLDEKLDLNLMNEIKATFWKLYVVLFLSRSNFYLKFFISSSYLLLRLVRLLITRKKVLKLR
jgi:glycosyltransferase involved in cell wall biosynthesis